MLNWAERHNPQERERLTEETQLKVSDDEHKINDVYFVDQPYILSGYVV